MLSNICRTKYWEVGNIDTEWMQLGRNEPLAAQESVFAFGLKLISTQECWGVAATRKTMNIEREGLVQGNQDAR